MSDLLLFAGCLVLLLVAARSVWLRRRTRRSLRALASRRRLNFSPGDLIGAYERYHHLDLINRGHSRHVWNILYGTLPHGLVTLFAYTFERGLGARRSNHHRWVVVLETPRMNLPWTACRRDTEHDTDLLCGGWHVRAAHEEAREMLERLALGEGAGLSDMESEWEIQGRYVALACPLTQDDAQPERMLNEVVRVAEYLRSAASPSTD